MMGAEEFTQELAEIEARADAARKLAGRRFLLDLARQQLRDKLAQFDAEAESLRMDTEASR